MYFTEDIAFDLMLKNWENVNISRREGKTWDSNPSGSLSHSRWEAQACPPARQLTLQWASLLDVNHRGIVKSRVFPPWGDGGSYTATFPDLD